MRDSEIRSALHNNFLSHFRKDGHSKIVDELKICGGRTVADVAVINGSLHVYEIKGEFDTVERLQVQVSNYSKTFDYITVVASKKHVHKIKEIVPSYCGIWQLTYCDKVLMKELIQPSILNFERDAFSIAQLLWRDEALTLIEKSVEQIKPYKKLRKWLLWEELSKMFSVDELSAHVRSILKSRNDWKLSRFLNE